MSFFSNFSRLYTKHNVMRYVILKLGIVAFVTLAFALSLGIRLIANYKLDEQLPIDADQINDPKPEAAKTHLNSLPYSIAQLLDNILSPKPLITERPPEKVGTTTAEKDITSNNFDNSTSHEVTIQKGDTLLHILRQYDTLKEDITALLLAIKKYKGKIHLTIGQTIRLIYETEIIENDGDLTTERQALKEIIIHMDNTHQVTFSKINNQFVIEKKNVQLSKQLERRKAKIEGALIATLKKMGIRSSHIIELVNAYSHQIDFQRQIRSGDTVTITYEKFFEKEGGAFSHYGKIIHASLELSGKNYDIYRYKPSKKANAEFFTPEGKGVKRSLLRTPLKVIRISSRYGRRKHPILGYTKMHTGVDFAAPTGTPIYAAGDGVVTRIGWVSGYGRFIQLKHNSKLSTAYAHASKFAKGLKKGSRVKQGQIIAYVGKTGRATAPHLHYEIRINGKHTNPMKYKTTAGKELKGKTLESFKKFQKDINSLNEKLASSSPLPDELTSRIWNVV